MVLILENKFILVAKLSQSHMAILKQDRLRLQLLLIIFDITCIELVKWLNAVIDFLTLVRQFFVNTFYLIIIHSSLQFQSFLSWLILRLRLFFYFSCTKYGKQVTSCLALNFVDFFKSNSKKGTDVSKNRTNSLSTYLWLNLISVMPWDSSSLSSFSHSTC